MMDLCMDIKVLISPGLPPVRAVERAELLWRDKARELRRFGAACLQIVGAGDLLGREMTIGLAAQPGLGRPVRERPIEERVLRTRGWIARLMSHAFRRLEPLWRDQICDQGQSEKIDISRLRVVALGGPRALREAFVSE